jgi:hypothetical protein
MNIGDIVLQPFSFSDLASDLIAIRSPRYSHCGIVHRPGWMVASDLTQGGVCEQKAGATGNIFIPYAWKHLDKTLFSAMSYVGRPYDFLGWIYALLGIRKPNYYQQFTCSSLVGALLWQDNQTTRDDRAVTPDDIARHLSAEGYRA